jgi:hypothetical protein
MSRRGVGGVCGSLGAHTHKITKRRFKLPGLHQDAQGMPLLLFLSHEGSDFKPRIK